MERSKVVPTSVFKEEGAPIANISFIPPSADNNNDGSSITPKLNRNSLAFPKPEPITYTWNNLNAWVGAEGKGNVDVESGSSKCYKWKKKDVVSKQILNNVTGIVKPGELLAIMGSSGAGKTTLLNLLTFRNSGKLRISGERKLNGINVTPDMLTSVSAYIQQEDLFIPTLTVREHLVFQALVRMHKHLTYKQRMERVEEVIQELGLMKCADTTIGMPGRMKGISGGEMKRLAFASEVLTDCQLVLCDEPTSGLDSYMAMNVIELLKDMASKGKTIICTIHQPSSEVYGLFDQLLLMAEGRTAYLGNSTDALEFFNRQGYNCPPNFNPGDFFIQTLAIQPGIEHECSQKVAKICDNYDNSDISESIKNMVEKVPNQNAAFFEMQANMKNRSPYKASWMVQFRAVLWRSWIGMIKDPMVIKVRLIQTVIISLLLGAIYFGQKKDQKGVMNINGALFLFLTNMTFQNVFAVINVFCVELPIFLREHFNGMYRTDVYFLCKMLAEVPLYIIFPMAFISISYFMVKFNSDIDRFLVACVIIILVANVGCSFGYMISCISGSIDLALTVSPALIIPLMIFGGFFLNKDSVPVYFIWLRYLSWFLYGNELLAINQWDGMTEIECDPLIPGCLKDGDLVLKGLNFDKNNKAMDYLGLILLLVGYRLVAFFALLFRTYRKH